METLNAGTKELFSVQLDDRLGTLTTLDGINVESKVMTEDEETIKQDWATVIQTVDMRVDALIDTTGWNDGTYKLYLRINVPPELPIIGPFEFGVS
jgi:hypothetical protein